MYSLSEPAQATLSLLLARFHKYWHSFPAVDAIAYIQYYLPNRQYPTSGHSVLASAAHLALFAVCRNVPDLPKLEALVPCTGDDHVSTRRNGTEENARVVCVANFCHSFETGVGPHSDGIGGIAVGAKQFFAMRREVQACNLGRRGVGVQTRAGRAVPYVDGCIVCASTGCEEVGLPR